VQPTGAKNSHSPAAAALLSTGVYRASASRRCWWALTPPLHPYLCWDPSHRRYVSVALSSRFPALGFPQRCVLLKARTFLILLPGGGSEDGVLSGGGGAAGLRGRVVVRLVFLVADFLVVVFLAGVDLLLVFFLLVGFLTAGFFVALVAAIACPPDVV